MSGADKLAYVATAVALIMVIISTLLTMIYKVFNIHYAGVMVKLCKISLVFVSISLFFLWRILV